MMYCIYTNTLWYFIWSFEERCKANAKRCRGHFKTKISSNENGLVY